MPAKKTRKLWPEFRPIGHTWEMPASIAGAGPVPGFVPGLMRPTPTINRAPAIGNTKALNPEQDVEYLRIFKSFKEECFADRWLFERQWTRTLHYLNNRQWLAPYSRTEGWRDARTAKGIPRPTTQKVKEADQAIRAMFTAIKFGVQVRPNGQRPDNILTAQTADDLAPMLHELHDMDVVMNQSDFWFVNLGNSILHTCWDYDAKYGKTEIPYSVCNACKKEFSAVQIYDAKQRCPACNEVNFSDAIDPTTGERKVEMKSQGGAITEALSPLEIAFPFTYPTWASMPGLIRMRWRNKRFYEENAALKDYVPKIQWQKNSSDRSLQIFQSLPFQNDLPSSRHTGSEQTSSREAEGVAEYEMYLRPTPEHPEGLVIRVAGDSNPIVIHNEDEEGLPGPLPYHDVKGNPLFTFSHMGYHHVGGRVLGSGAHDPVMGKYDALNRIDSLIEMIIMRMASPQWMVPKGSNVQWLGDSPGLPGLLLEWSAQIAGAAGRPERVAGIGVEPSIMTYRAQLVDDIENGLGLYDILKGAKPSGVEAFSALQLLVERGQQRFAGPFMARGHAYKEWFGFALELEREFGPEDRTLAIMSPTRSYAFRTFKRANLKGDVTIIIEDGTYTPKTSLGERAAIQHLDSLKGLNMKDPDQMFVVFRKFGLTDLLPAVNAHTQAALKKQEDFQKFIDAGKFAQLAKTGAAPEAILASPEYPLVYRRWYNPEIHRQEFLKWANGDWVQQTLRKMPPVAGLLEAHLMEIDLAIAEQAMALDPGGNKDAGGAPVGTPANDGNGGGAGAGMALVNSNQNSGALHTLPGGPAMQGGQAPS